MNKPVNLDLDYRDDCLVIQTHGRDIFNRTEETVQAVAAAMRARPVAATLLDLRSVPGTATFLNRFQLGETAGRHLPRQPIAVLIEEHLTDPKRIGRLAARNRGVNVEVFTDPAAAHAWLKKHHGSRPPR